MKLKLLKTLLVLLFATSAIAVGQETETVDTTLLTEVVDAPAPPSAVSAKDKDNDHGHAVVVAWELSADDGAGRNSVMSYEIFRWVPYFADTVESARKALEATEVDIDTASVITSQLRQSRKDARQSYSNLLEQYPQAYAGYPENGDWKSLSTVPSGATRYEDAGSKNRMAGDFLPDFCDFRYRVEAVTVDSTVRGVSEVAGPVQSSGQWFNGGRIPVLVAVLIFGFLTLLFVTIARKGKDLYVRPLPGIEAVDDAIGRATEMGRPILYVLGLGTAADVATIASFTILARVAKRVAEYQTKLIVPTYDPIVMAVAQEVVKSAYLDAGRPDDYDEDIVHFVTQSQFAYVAAVNGTMLRELPATNVYMGKFFAESLLLAETGAVAGSIQIAGTDEIAQIPFFIVACDYTLIGEELYAASAYLGREPILLGSLKAQDWAKAAVIVFSIVGLAAANLDWGWFPELFRVTD